MIKDSKKFSKGSALSMSKGFGLLEVMISATVIIIILGALVLVANASMRNNQYVQMRAEATYLAQEGIERVRSIRDSNWIDQDPNTKWDNLTLNTTTTGFDPNATTNGCYKVFNGKISNIYRYGLKGNFSSLQSNDCESYAKDSDINKAEEIKNYPAQAIVRATANPIIVSAPANKYYRTIYIDRETTTLMSPSVSPELNSLKVTVNVGFKFNGKEKVVSVSEIMTNWKPDF